MNGTTVVVVGNELAWVMQAKDSFESAGLKVLAYPMGEDALAFVLSNQTEVAALLTDLMLPGVIDGVSLALKVERACPSIAVVATAEAGTARPDDLPSSAIFLLRPWEPLDVINAILDFHQSM